MHIMNLASKTGLSFKLITTGTILTQYMIPEEYQLRKD